MGTHPIFESDFDCLTYWKNIFRILIMSLEDSIKKTFEKIDTNKDDKLSQEELKKVMMENFEKVGVEIEEESLDRMVLQAFTDMDTNKDGKISIAEFQGSSWALVLS